MRHFKTVLGDITEHELGITLVHEHICCANEFVYKMYGEKYLNKTELIPAAVSFLQDLKEKYNLSTLVDCTPVSLGRDVDLLKEVSEKSNVNIICSTGFYYNDEPMLHETTVQTLAEYMIYDAKNVNAGIIKCAVEHKELGLFNKMALVAAAIAQKELGLPIVVHTNAKNRNGAEALEILLSEGIAPQAITIGHLSDTEDLEYVKEIAEKGCFIGFDRVRRNTTEDYICRKVHNINYLFDSGFGDQLLLSHDALIFNGFVANPGISKNPGLTYCFDNILPRLSPKIVGSLMVKNPVKMLCCGEHLH